MMVLDKRSSSAFILKSWKVLYGQTECRACSEFGLLGRTILERRPKLFELLLRYISDRRLREFASRGGGGRVTQRGRVIEALTYDSITQ